MGDCLYIPLNALLSRRRGELDTRQRQSEIIKLEATLQSRFDALKGKRRAFSYEGSIDRATNKKQLDLLNEDIALAELEIHETKIDGMDLEATLNFATNALSNGAEFWIQCSPDQKQRFQRVLFPNPLVFHGESYRTAETCSFQLPRGLSEGNSSLASQSIPSWNQIIDWLKEMEMLRQVAA